MGTDEERFNAKVDRSQLSPGGCWPWTAAVRSHARPTMQYGVFNPHGKTVIASRWAWERNYGPIPKGLWVLHRCDNPPCVNPAHLWLGTREENIADCVRKGRNRHTNADRLKARSHCKNGHEFTPENTRISKIQRTCRTCARLSMARRRASDRLLVGHG